MTRSDITARFQPGLIAAAMHEWGFKSVGDMARDYGLGSIYQMLEEFERDHWEKLGGQTT